jgi:hypothetical protein
VTQLAGKGPHLGEIIAGRWNAAGRSYDLPRCFLFVPLLCCCPGPPERQNMMYHPCTVI